MIKIDRQSCVIVQFVEYHSYAYPEMEVLLIKVRVFRFFGGVKSCGLRRKGKRYEVEGERSGVML